MKRFVVPLFALFAITVPLAAHADWVDTPLSFRVSGVGPTGGSTGIWVRDTIRTRLNGVTSSGPLDTLADFRAEGVGVVGLGAHETAAVPRSDSLLCGWLIFTTDSTAGGWSSLQVAFQGRGGGNENFSPVTAGNYQHIDSLSVAITGGNRIFAVPVTPSKLGFPILRAITTAGVGNSPTTTCVWRHWVPTSASRREQ